MKCKICGCTSEPLTRTNHTMNDGKLFCLQCKECGTSTNWSNELHDLRCLLFGNNEQDCRLNKKVELKESLERSIFLMKELGCIL